MNNAKSDLTKNWPIIIYLVSIHVSRFFLVKYTDFFTSTIKTSLPLQRVIGKYAACFNVPLEKGKYTQE